MKANMSKTEERSKHPELLVNRWMTPDGTILHSKAPHDYVRYWDEEERYYAVDSTLSGLVRITGNLKNLCLYEDDPHEEVRKYFCWGTYGKNGDQPHKWVALKDMSNLHIDAILRTHVHIRGTVVERVFIREVKYRLDNNIVVVE